MAMVTSCRGLTYCQAVSYIPLTPTPFTCRLRSKKSRTQQKRTQRKLSQKHPTVGLKRSVENIKGLSKNDNFLCVSTSNFKNDSEGISSKVESDEVPKTKQDQTSREIIDNNDPLELGIDCTLQRSLGMQIEDLLNMIKDAEKNILLLNEARVRALEELNQIRAEKEDLQSQVSILQTRLAETNARLKTEKQEDIKTELLKSETKGSERKNNGGASIQNDSNGSSIDPDIINGKGALSTRLNSIGAVTPELKILENENNVLKDQIKILNEKVNDLKKNKELLEVFQKDKLALEGFVKKLEAKLAIAEANGNELYKVKAECQNLQTMVKHLQSEVDIRTKSMSLPQDITNQNQTLQQKPEILENDLAKAEEDKRALEQTKKENILLQEQVKVLEQRLIESDKEIRAQLQIYQEEVQAFQRSLEEMKRRDGPVQDMPWEFWSTLLLSIDGWMFEKKLTVNDARLLRDMAWSRDARIRDAFVQSKAMDEKDTIISLLKLVKSNTRSGLHVIHIAAEMAPVAKVGGLGDVVTGLGKALQKRGHLVEVLLPKYDCMDYGRIKKLRVLETQIDSYFDGQLFKNRIWVGTVEGLPVYFIEPLHPAKFFWRGQFYGEGDDFRRFTYFCRAALEFLLQSGKRPDIIHCHDWQTAFIAPLYWDLYAPKGFNSARIAFTCHNFEYQGTESASALASCGLDVQQLNRPDRMQDNTRHDRVNAVKGGIVFSNIVTTVSPTYAEEIRASEGGKGLHLTVVTHSRKFNGILNGIDTETWNPSPDPFLDCQYSADDITGKMENKKSLQRYLGLDLSSSAVPLVGCITRLVPQKGIHLIRHAIYRTLECGGQFVLLGNSPVPHIQREFEGIANQFSGHPSIRLVLKYDETLSHYIYAGSDIFIVPSIFEPCGLTQMIAMRYGSIPVARRTGGLNDSVFDVDDETIPTKIRNGFTFLTADEKGVNFALDRAILYYRQEPNWWLELVKKVMKLDFSWDASATQYEELYEKAVARARSHEAHAPSSN